MGNNMDAIMKRLTSILVAFAFCMMVPVLSWGQEISTTINPGWNWVSYPRAESLSLSQALANLIPTEGDIVKSQNSFSLYSDEEWAGSLNEFVPSIGYMYKSNSATSFSFSFPTPHSSDFQTTLNPGWNWISYARADELTIDEAFANLTPTEGDIIKSQTSFSMFTDGSWSGSLVVFTPGQGYMYKSHATTAVTFTYPEPASCNKPSVITYSVTDIGRIAATANASLTNDGGGTVTERGFCWGLSHNPTVSGSHISLSGSDIGLYTANMKVLQAGKTYYVRAYAINEAGVGYGAEKTFNTLSSISAPTGALPALYTVNANGNQVFFSKGNLFYDGDAETPSWGFFTSQWEYLGGDEQGTNNEKIKRDLFCWGTSNYPHGAVNYQPWKTSTDYLNYKIYGDNTGTMSLYDGTGKADWGYNKIWNGGNKENLWRTPKGGENSEWVYILQTRTTNSGILYAKAKVDTVCGLIILPDDWSAATYTLNYPNNPNKNYTVNKISISDWNTYFQSVGCVFLPCAGGRYGDRVDKQNSAGGYWSSTTSGSLDTAYGWGFYSSMMLFNYAGTERGGGGSVRLVRDYVP